MTKYCTINCTAASEKDAVELAKILTEKKLIACCNIIPSVTSVYEWKNELYQDKEVLMIMKTKSCLFKAVEAQIKKHHKYELPEIIALPVENGSIEYLNWIDEQTRE